MPTRPYVSVIVPTYCEADNLPELVQRISASLRPSGRNFEILIVDDASPDETVRVSQALAKQQFPVCLIVRQDERGLSSAVIAGMDEASGEILVVMDADLSHPPERIPDLVALLKRPEVDFAIGSRYVAGGSTSEDWGLLRYLNSRVATLMARGLTSARDPLAGFFALRRHQFIEAKTRLDPVGFKIGLELIVKAHCRYVVETPIRFANRRRGTSKLSWRQQLEYVQHLRRLYRYRRSTQSVEAGPETAPGAPSAARRAA